VTVNITAVVLTFISAVSSVDETSVLTAVQLLWVNLIMDTFAALALATDAPTASILNRKPEPKSAPLINLSMWKMIIGQSIYQLAVSLLLFFGGSSVFGYRLPDDQPRLQTFIFNAFVWMQIFNQYNCRCLDNRFNIFEGMWRNSFFLGIQIAIVGGQLLIVFFGGAAFSVTPLNAVEWAYSVGLGAVSLPVAILVRLIPDGFLSHLLPDFLNRKTTPRLVVSDEERQFQWNPALEEIREELALLKLLRGGRLNILKYKLHHPREFLPRSRSGSRSPNRSMPQTPVNEPATELGSPGPPTPGSQRSLTRRRSRSRSNSAFGPAAAMAGIVAGSIGGWSHMERRDGDEGIGLFVPLHDSRGRDAPASPDIQPRTESNDPVPTDPFSTLSDPPYPPQVAAPSPSSSSGLAPPPIHLGLAPPPVPSSQGSGLSHRPHASA
jgi:Ca2+-transporting ATPase